MTPMNAYRLSIVALASALTLALAPVHAQPVTDPAVTAILKNVDALRAGRDSLKVETMVTSIKSDGSTDKQRNFTVFLQPDRRVLIISRAAVEQGQKLLMINDDFWLVTSGSQRPLRITATQKMVGDAAIADIATVRWADDYSGKKVGEEPCGEQTCVRLELTAVRESISYSRIDLWVGKAKSEPVKADMYLQSGKLAKSAHFVLDNPRAPTLVLETVLSDELSNIKETRIRYLSRESRTVPAEWFNPLYLASNPSVN